MTPLWRDQVSHRLWLDAEARRLLTFARGARLPSGFGWLGDDGVPIPDRPQPLWITARFTHVFALADLMGAPGSAALCDHGLAALLDDFADPEHGGWFAELQDGQPSRPDKEAYSFAFVVLALSSAAIAGRSIATPALRATLDLVLERFWREDEGACCDVWSQDWSVCEPYRGANANMHMVEAFLAAADATGDAVWRDRALRICERLIHDVARRHDWRVIEHFDATWRPLPDYNADAPDHPFRPFGITPGHGLEWARLLIALHGSLAAPPAWLIEAAQGLFARAVDDGWAAPGGFLYTTDLSGAPVIDKRMHWVTTEAIAAAAALQDAIGGDLYEAWYRRAWDFAAAHLIDTDLGSWRHELAGDLSPVGGVWSGKPDIYHAFQATLIPRLPSAGSLAGGLKTQGLR